MWREHTLYRRSVRCARSRKGYTISLLPLYRAIAYSYPEGDATVISKTFSPKPGYVRVIFELPVSLWAHRVYLVADFNGWDPTAMPFKQERGRRLASSRRSAYRASLRVPLSDRRAMGHGLPCRRLYGQLLPHG